MRVKHRGFTLIEILIALFIFTVITVILTKALHTVIASQTATEKYGKQLEERQLALLLFSRDLSQAIDSSLLTAGKKQESTFMGMEDNFSFTELNASETTANTARPSLQHTAYHFENGQFFRDSWATEASTALPHSRLLLDGVKQLQFRYLDHQKIFHAFWPPEGETTKLPRAVEITISFDSGETLEQLYLLPAHPVTHATS